MATLRIETYFIQRIGLLISTFLVFGCDQRSNNPEAHFKDYIARISAVQESEKLTIPSTIYHQVPAKRELQFALPTIQLGLLEGYELRKCGLFHLIAERNSILGKVQDDFRLMEFQIKLLSGLTHCIQSNAISEDLKAKLIRIQLDKQQQLPFRLYNLIYASQSMQKQLSATQWLDSSSLTATNSIKHAMETIKGYQSYLTINSTNLASLSNHQEPIEKQLVLGPLLFSLLNSAQLLETATAQLKRYDHKVICGKNRNQTRFRHLINVFQISFTKRIQPYLVSLDRIYQTLQPELVILSTQYLDSPHSKEKIHISA